jgi:sugar phosphate isomerase/epimerase
VHLHDNDGTADSHWAIGRGRVDFEKFFGLMRKHSPVPVFTVEAHEKEDIETSLGRMESLLKERE